jgi:hypothetical protein
VFFFLLCLILPFCFHCVSGKDEKLTHLDENAIRDIVGKEEEEENSKLLDANKTQLKAKNKVKQRLDKERKAARDFKTKTQQSDTANDDEDDVAILSSFAKGSRQKKKE